MKTINKIYARSIVVLLVLLMLSGSAIYAQRGRNNTRPNQRLESRSQMGFDLTEDQKEQLKTMQLEKAKALKPLKNQLNENRAKYKTLTSAESFDMKAIHANIDERTDLQNKMAKIGVAQLEKFRSILTEEQKLRMELRQEQMRPGGSRHQLRFNRGSNHNFGRMQRFKPVNNNLRDNQGF